jgi:zinc protease
VEMPSMQREYLVPSFKTAKGGESEALEVLAHILGSGSNSRLYRALVVDKQVAVMAGAWYDASALDESKFGVQGSPRPGVTLPQLETDTDAVIAQVIDKGVTGEELERAKTRLIADSLYAQDNQASMARWYGASLTTGSTVNDVRHWPDRIRAVTADQVRDAARHWLDKRRSVTGYLIKDVSPQAEKRS